MKKNKILTFLKGKSRSKWLQFVKTNPIYSVCVQRVPMAQAAYCLWELYEQSRFEKEYRTQDTENRTLKNKANSSSVPPVISVVEKTKPIFVSKGAFFQYNCRSVKNRPINK